jgi:hypothetical protein
MRGINIFHASYGTIEENQVVPEQPSFESLQDPSKERKWLVLPVPAAEDVVEPAGELAMVEEAVARC